MEMLQRSCPLCGSNDDSCVYAEANFDFSKIDSFAFASRKIPEFMHYRLIACPCCDLLYANPVPSAEGLAHVYQEAAFDSSAEAHYAARTYGRFLPGIMPRLPDLSGTLDIGTGDGAFLEELLKAGFTDVMGVEPSRAPIAAARDDIRPLIREGVFRPEDFSGTSFSLVTCFQTLEHLPDPLRMCRQAYVMLKPGGCAFFVSHDWRSLPTRILGTKSPIFDVEHLQLFSPDSARYLLKQSGFRTVEIQKVINRYPLSYWLKLLPFPPRLKMTLLKTLAPVTDAISLPLPVGNIAIVGFTTD